MTRVYLPSQLGLRGLEDDINARDLGGIQTSRGMTCEHRFVRSGSTSELSRHDVRTLADYGVSMVLDLRSNEEARIAPDRLARKWGVRSARVPLHAYNLRDEDAHVSGEARENDGAIDLSLDTDNFFASGYISMLHNAMGVRTAFAFMAKTKKRDCLLFHCAAGMDRTGVLAMLILGACGASRRQILRDYLLSFASGERVDALLDGRREGPDALGDIPTFLFDLGSLAEGMGLVIDCVLQRYGTFESYLTACGVLERHVEAVRTHLLG